ncbi:ABC transporter ATP-binding protein [Streptomyces litchfieldiae]|uniref:ABC transporter ATP-binding protein n=1 Tax=Streptomyces litchfieldiae TaxID=3075543 RepID=A0ABU2MX75_9ACTN|nr:ABC transporter ATP-binding protein [Streptomyces sp. DSM 44938]MDT0345883.1 ABC transporter ATP-binding protein [Streptomyces sp. DSM 44938]
MESTQTGPERPPHSISQSEQLLFGGPLLYDTGWSSYDGAFARLSLWSMVATLPRLIVTTVRLARDADRDALRVVAAAELGRGVAQAIGLVAVNTVLAALLAEGAAADRLRDALPALVAVAVTALLGALLAAASTYGSGRLEPKVERVATERYLARAAAVELAAIEDDQFHRLLDTAQYGATSARRMIDYCVRVVNALLSLVAAASVLTVLHPVLLPLLALMTVPSMWRTLVTTRRRYQSFRTWVQHARASRVLSSELTATETAAEIRVHQVGPFLLKHFRDMSASSEAEQTRLARLDARTGLWASAWTGLASIATYLTLGALAWGGTMAMSVAGTAVLAIRTGSASLSGMVHSINNLYDESLFVADLDRLCTEAAGWAIPTGGRPIPRRPRRITFENVTFRYPGTDAPPALADVTLTIPTGRITALVGENGSGKSTLVKLLAGLYLPESGSVTWDGVPTTQADRHQLFARIAMVAQDFNRWRFTARVNITIGAPNIPIDEDRLRAAARDSGADTVVEDLPRGWDTLLARGYQGGHQLSGGQWQRLGIARAHYRGAPVLIVDEPTAALDAKEEQRVFDQIRDLAAAGQTVILITHRMASVRHADLVHVLHHGRLVESGSPSELLARPDGHFSELYGIQAAQFERRAAPAGTPGAPASPLV